MANYAPSNRDPYTGHPLYPDLGAKIAKARGAVPYSPKAHGRAVLEAIRRLQISELRRGPFHPTDRRSEHVKYAEAIAAKREIARHD